MLSFDHNDFIFLLIKWLKMLTSCLFFVTLVIKWLQVLTSCQNHFTAPLQKIHLETACLKVSHGATFWYSQ